MRIKSVVSDNLGYALLGGPAVALFLFVPGAGLWGVVEGIVIAVLAYGLGWLQIARRWSEDPDPDSDSDSEGLSTEGKAKAWKASYGGDGGVT